MALVAAVDFTAEVSVVVSAAVASVLAVFVAVLWLLNTLQAVSRVAAVALGLAIPMPPACAERDFAQPPTSMEVLRLQVEVSAAQPRHTTQAAARLLLGHTNSADEETNR